jgi:hypothetical protein
MATTSERPVSEMRAVGIAAKFGYAFANAGGTLDMMSHIANDSERMAEIVKIADRWLLTRGEGTIHKFTRPFVYNPAECFTVGEHQGVKIIRVKGSMKCVAVSEERSVQNLSLLPYTLRKMAERSSIFAESHRHGVTMTTTIDHMWVALTHSAQAPERSVLAMDGSVNEFYLPFKTRSGPFYFPLHLTYCNAEGGWEMYAVESMAQEDLFKKGTRFIFDGDKNE